MKQKQPTKKIAARLSEHWIGIHYRWLIAILGMLLYVQAVGFEYTLDDELFVTKNVMVKEGLAGIPAIFTNGSLIEIGIQPYRPITLVTFALGKSLFNNAVAIEHLINVLLYGLLLTLLYTVLRQSLSRLDPMLVAASCLLFALHPLHSEVVASVKSRDELLAACFGLLSWIGLSRVPSDQPIPVKVLLISALWFLLALFSKESGIVFMVLIPLGMVMLQSRSFKTCVKPAAILTLMALIFLLVRFAVIGAEYSETDVPLLANVLNGASGFSETSATKMAILYHNLRLIVAPWPLVWDRSYNEIPLSNWGSMVSWKGLLSYGILSILAVFNFQKRPLLSFGILFFFIASSPTNNLFLVTGAVLGERFLFTPSIGLCIVLPWLVAGMPESMVNESGQRRLRLTLMVLGSIYALLTLQRIPDWKNNLQLFQRGVEVAPNSARTNYALASELMRGGHSMADPALRKARYAEAMVYFKKSVEILPVNHESHYNAGMCAALLGDTMLAMQHYRTAIQLRPAYFTAINNLAVIYGARLQFDSAQVCYERVLQLRPDDQLVRSNLSNLHFGKGVFAAQAGDSKRALAEYDTSLKYDPKNIKVINNTASLYAGLTQYDSALVYLYRAYSIEPANLMIIENISAVNFLAGKTDQAIDFANRGLAINPRSGKSIGVLVDAWTRKGDLAKAAEYRRQLGGN